MNIPSNARVYDLEQPRYFGAPIHPSHTPGYFYTLHRRHERGMGEARTGASGFMYTTEHSGTHIDALCHQAENLHLYGGREIDAKVQTSFGFTELGVETIAPLITRGVLLDIARQRGVDHIGAGNPIRRDEVEAAADFGAQRRDAHDGRRACVHGRRAGIPHRRGRADGQSGLEVSDRRQHRRRMDTKLRARTPLNGLSVIQRRLRSPPLERQNVGQVSQSIGRSQRSERICHVKAAN